MFDGMYVHVHVDEKWPSANEGPIFGQQDNTTAHLSCDDQGARMEGQRDAWDI